MKNKKILVVDDDEAILEAFELTLTDADYIVETTAKNGTVVDNKIEKFHPDLIVLDLLLSGSDGRNITRRLKSDPKTKNIPIIMISAHPNAKKSALEAGAEDFLAKPFEMTVLMKKINYLLSGKRK